MAAIIGNRNITLGVMGGTLITACAGFGGDVFGCSPYDAATTRYLKATYPQYWQAIRNFGFDNPQLVPWINEDNDLIVSLVEVGKERSLVGNGNGYFKTGVIVDSVAGYFEIRYRKRGNLNTNNFGVDTSSGVRKMHGNIWSTSCYIGNSGHITGLPQSLNTWYVEKLTITDTDVTLDLNGNVYRKNGLNGWVGSTIEDYLFATNAGNGSAGYIMQGDITYLIERFGTQDHKFVPFKRNGQMELLDIVTGTLATRVGTFTELIE